MIENAQAGDITRMLEKERRARTTQRFEDPFKDPTDTMKGKANTTAAMMEALKDLAAARAKEPASATTVDCVHSRF
jgi:hypothetical protein